MFYFAHLQETPEGNNVGSQLSADVSCKFCKDDMVPVTLALKVRFVDTIELLFWDTFILMSFSFSEPIFESPFSRDIFSNTDGALLGISHPAA